MTDQVLKKLQNTEFDMMCDIDTYCRKHNIKYSLYAGTMLGAVRHGGFIPWDDDVDICMTRKEYTKFCRAIIKYPLKGYYFQNYEIDNNCMMNHGKIRKNGTALLSEGEDKNKGNHGIWIDIFPLDKYSSNRVQAFKTAFLGVVIVFLSRANLTLESDDKKKVILNKAIRLIPQKIRKRILLFNAKKLRQYDKRINRDYVWTSMSALSSFKLKYPQNMVNNYTTLRFNDREFMSYKDYEDMLTIIYGDYMKLPPESERICKHNPIEIKF